MLTCVVASAYAQVNLEEDGEATQGDPSAQEGNVAIRKLRLRRPRPISIDNEDGIAQGNPVPLRAGSLCRIIRMFQRIITILIRSRQFKQI